MRFRRWEWKNLLEQWIMNHQLPNLAAELSWITISSLSWRNSTKTTSLLIDTPTTLQWISPSTTVESPSKSNPSKSNSKRSSNPRFPKSVASRQVPIVWASRGLLLGPIPKALLEMRPSTRFIRMPLTLESRVWVLWNSTKVEVPQNSWGLGFKMLSRMRPLLKKLWTSIWSWLVKLRLIIWWCPRLSGRLTNSHHPLRRVQCRKRLPSSHQGSFSNLLATESIRLESKALGMRLQQVRFRLLWFLKLPNRLRFIRNTMRSLHQWKTASLQVLTWRWDKSHLKCLQASRVFKWLRGLSWVPKSGLKPWTL